MPAQQPHRRVKGKRITRAFVIGTEAWKLNDKNKPSKGLKPGDTTGWRVYVRPVPGGPDISTWLKKVVFVLHETFPNPVRTLENTPFELEETGYGGFYIVVKLYFQPIASEKQQQRSHFLQLDKYGDEAMQAEQDRNNLVRSEVVEFIEFNEPTEALWDALTSDNQWNYMLPKGKGKNRAAAANAQMPSGLPPPRGERTVDIPEQTPVGSVYNRETERQLIKLLTDAAVRCDKETMLILTSIKNVNEEILKAKEGIDIDAKLLTLHEKIPPKKK